VSIARFRYAQSALGGRECRPAAPPRVVIASGWIRGRETLLSQAEGLDQAEVRAQGLSPSLETEGGIMNRRTFLATAAFGLLATPIAAEAQQAGKVPRIGVLSSAPGATWDGFRQGLRELGYTEGRTILIEWRWTEGKAERAPELAADLVRLQPDVIVTGSPQPTAAGKAATATIPIVFIAVADPVRVGLVATLARPGGNITGLATLVGAGFVGKLIEAQGGPSPGLAGGLADQSYQRDAPRDRGQRASAGG
jgi:hypothetical protein